MSTIKTPSMLNAYLLLHFIVFIWGFTAILGKLIEIPAVEVVFYRTLFASIGLYALLKWRKIPIKVPKKELWTILGTGVLIAIHWILFFLAARISNVSICLAGMATASLWTSFIDPMVNKRKIKFYEPLVAIVSVIGIAVVFQSTIDAAMGFIVAIISAFLAAVFTVINGKLVAKQNHFTITYYEMIGACGTVVLFFPVYGYWFTDYGLSLLFTTSDFIYLLILSLICTVYAYSIAVKLMQRLTAFTINLTINLEPVYGITVAVFLFGSEEKMDGNFYWGTAIIVLSVIMYPLLRRYFDGKNIKRDIVR
ncbi:EamA domain-containing membrane protein RarD [Reichenbachiella faecimaris]|uniref:EamA domain-containing membrane protein RarD n=1 Tax=Reichenbachiella faecimaris TaxID=692418 RepID=A0A1W2G6M2_REIFA|nr:DMT family transporter [Reichenbachiella faecimaris]SMD32315.1 EamA domain-containing membrane protein RarD [Reichenbachiella faecimaris]